MTMALMIISIDFGLSVFQVINHKDYSDREAFDAALHEALVAAGVEIVCLAGFMRILTGKPLTWPKTN